MPEYHFVKDVLTVFLRDTKRYKKPSTNRSEAFHSVPLERYFKGYWITYSPEDLTTRKKVITGRVVRAYRDFRASQGIKPITIKRELSIASSACKWAIRECDKEIPNPFEGRLISKAEQMAWKPRDVRLTEAEEERLLNCCDPELREILIFLIDTGLRRSEAINLTWDRVDMVNALITFGPQDHKSGNHASCVLMGRSFGILKGKQNREGKVFQFTDRLLRSRFEKARKRAGLNVNVHDLRRTCGERVRLAYGVEVAQAQLRHKDIRVTERTYAPANVNIILNALKSANQSIDYSGYMLPAPYSGCTVLSY